SRVGERPVRNRDVVRFVRRRSKRDSHYLREHRVLRRRFEVERHLASFPYPFYYVFELLFLEHRDIIVVRDGAPRLLVSVIGWGRLFELAELAHEILEFELAKKAPELLLVEASVPEHVHAN